MGLRNNRVEDSCLWLFQTAQYRSWQGDQDSSILTITGDAGCGKTTLVSFLIETWRNPASKQHDSDTITCAFFCSQQFETQSDARSVVRGLLVQLLSSGRAVIRQVKAKFGSTLLLFDQSFETLWSIFLYTIEVTPYPSVLLVIDALDECNAESKEILIAKLNSTLRGWHTTSRSNPKKLKVLVTGQPRITTDLKAVSQSHSQYRIGLEDRPQGMIEDVLLFINRKVEELVLHNRCTVSFARSLRNLLNQMAQSCFLWVSLVLEHIKNTVEVYANDLPLLLTGLPDSLQEAYTRYLPSLPQHDYDSAKRYVSLLIASLRPLTVAEVGAFAGLAYSGDAQYPSRRSDVPVIKDRLEMVFGPLVLLVDSCVDFVHPTVKAFLLGLGSEQANELSKSHGTDIASAHLVIATACIRYLLTGEASKDLFTLADPQSTTSDTSNSCKELQKRPITLVLENPTGFKT